MKSLPFALSVVTLAFGVSLARADDTSATQPPTAQPPTNQPSAVQPSALPNNPPAMGSPQAAQAPPAGWTSLKGTVQSVDQTSKTVQLKDDTGNLVQIPVDKQVMIKKDGKRIELAQVQTGDSIILAKRKMSSQEKERSSAY